MIPAIKVPFVRLMRWFLDPTQRWGWLVVQGNQPRARGVGGFGAAASILGGRGGGAGSCVVTSAR